MYWLGIKSMTLYFVQTLQNNMLSTSIFGEEKRKAWYVYIGASKYRKAYTPLKDWTVITLREWGVVGEAYICIWGFAWINKYVLLL